MGFKCGIVGLPNVGKSTLFNAVTQSSILAANYPFATVEPNVGRVPLHDPRMDRLCEIVQPKATVPTYLDIVDIAGLVRGAATGEGLGNQFLGHIREVDAILHVVRCFEGEVTHVEGRIDPAGDVELIEFELILADTESAKQRLDKATRAAKSGKPDDKHAAQMFETIVAHLESGVPLRQHPDDEVRTFAQGAGMISAKPELFVANVGEDDLSGDNPYIQKLAQSPYAKDAQIVAVSAQFESELVGMDAAERAAFLQDAGLTESGLDQVVRAGYGLLDLQTFFTAGEQEVRAWTIPAVCTAPQAAGKIHTDFEKGFIRAEVCSYEDFDLCDGWTGARNDGKVRLEGKEYQMADGDVVYFRFNV